MLSCCPTLPLPLLTNQLQAYKTYRLGGEISELLYSPATYGLDLSSKDLIKPRARAAPMLCVLRNTMWMLGGQVRRGGVGCAPDPAGMPHSR
jgi:hypothetical protein